MGSIGSQQTQGNIVQFPVRTQQQAESNTSVNMVDNENGWTYPEIQQNLDKLENALKGNPSPKRITDVAIALQKQDQRITQEIERLYNNTADVKGSEKSLLTYRRKVRQLMQKARF